MEGVPKRPAKSQKKQFPVKFEKNGRTGKIYKTANGRFKTHFQFAGKPRQNTFATVEAAVDYLEDEFLRLDTAQDESQTLFPIRAKAKEIFELEQLLAERSDGTSLRDAVRFFLDNSKIKRLQPKTFSECIEPFIQDRKTANATGIHIKTLQKHFRRFEKDFGCCRIHEITSLEITNWLGTRTDEGSGKLWSAKTKRSVRGSLVTLSLFAQEILKAIPENGKTEFQKVRTSKDGVKQPVEIYTPEQLGKLLATATDIKFADLIPVIAIGCFLGLRPFEIHGEGLERGPLKWEAFNWTDNQLHVIGQKIRSKATRDIPLNDAVKAWLEPFKGLQAGIWTHKANHEKKMGALRKKAGIKGIDDGYRHSLHLIAIAN
jgi:hypothetical protein